jgi:hypothetical protein
MLLLLFFPQSGSESNSLVEGNAGFAEDAEAPAVPKKSHGQARPEAVIVSRQKFFVGRSCGDRERFERVDGPSAAPVLAIVDHQRNTQPKRQRPGRRVLEELVAQPSTKRHCDHTAPAFPESAASSAGAWTL